MYPWAAPEAALPGDTDRGDAAVGAGPSVPGLQVLSLGLTHPTEELGEFLCGRAMVWGCGVHPKPDGTIGIWS